MKVSAAVRDVVIASRQGSVAFAALLGAGLLLHVVNPADAATATTADTAQASTAVASDESGSLQEIVVTANRREETIQRSSLEIQAISGAEAASAVSQITDLSELVTGMQVSMSGGTSQIYIRGVGDYSANPLSNPGVAFNVDGVYVGRPEAVNSNFYDIARVEVLKGPQGTLYGRNSSGGAINLITNSPSLDGDKGTLNAEVGNYGLVHVDGAINVPLSDTFAVRGAFNVVTRNGYLSDGTDDDQEHGVRLKALWKPDDDLSVIFSIDNEGIGGKGTGYVYLPRRPGADPWEAVSSAQANAYLFSFPGSTGIITQETDSRIDNSFTNVSMQLDWNLGFATLTVIPAYRHSDTYDREYNAERIDLFDKAQQETFEARLSHSGDKLKWVTGVYYFNEKDPGQIEVDVGPSILFSKIPYNPSGISYAAFGETTFSVTDSFRLIAGARGTTEKRDLNGIFYLSPDNGASFAVHEVFNGEKTFNSFTWKLGTEYDLTPQNMLYFTASTGFKAGGLDQTIAPGNVYEPEKVLAFELGSRNRFLENRLQLNLEGFYWKYKNQQNNHLTFDTTGSINFLTQNAGDATLYGFNADLIAKLTRNDTLHVAAEYDHTRYSTFTYGIPFFLYNPAATGCRNAGQAPGPFAPLTQLDCSGYALPHAPEWTGLIDLSHDFDLASGAAIEFGASERLSSWTWLAVDFTPEERAPGFAMTNARVSYLSPKRNWTATAYVRNITNATEYTGGQEVQEVPQLIPVTISPPRTFGLQVHWDW